MLNRRYGGTSASNTSGINQANNLASTNAQAASNQNQNNGSTERASGNMLLADQNNNSNQHDDVRDMRQQLLNFVRNEALDNDDPSYDSDNQWLSRSDQSSPSSSSPIGASAMRSNAEAQRNNGHPPHGLPHSTVLQRNNYLAAPTPII